MPRKTASFFALILILILVQCTQDPENKQTPEVMITGAMKNVMWKGRLAGVINLDTIAENEHLNGLGPVEYLSGELTIIDGHAYKSYVLPDSSMKVEETFDARAPFFCYSRIEKWTETRLPDSIRNIIQLENYLDVTTEKMVRPFMFRLAGTVETATIHVVNLPAGSVVSTPKEAHEGQVNYYLSGEEADIVGFFSKEHQSIITHHDTYLHMHLITRNRQKMGHLDDVLFTAGTMKLFLPAQ